jgi:hypothetical protein
MLSSHLRLGLPSGLNLISIFRAEGRSKVSVQFRGPLWHFVTCFFFYGREFLAPRPTPKLEGHPWSAVRDCLFNIFAATLHIWRPSPPSATWGRAMPWWQGTHLTCSYGTILTKILDVCRHCRFYFIQVCMMDTKT